MKKTLFCFISFLGLQAFGMNEGESESSFQETFESETGPSIPLESPLLSVKVELGGGLVYGFSSALLEFQTPVITQNKKLKWLIQAGAGGIVTPFAGGGPWPYFPIDTGLRYNFQPFTTSLRGGVLFLLPEDIEHSFTAALSLGWNISHRIHIELSAGLDDIPHPDLSLSLSVSTPLKRW